MPGEPVPAGGLFVAAGGVVLAGGVVGGGLTGVGLLVVAPELPVFDGGV